MNQSPDDSRLNFLIASLVAFLMGSVTLVYQLVVIRFAMFHFGAESETLSAVICTTLIGLSVGAWTFGRASNDGLSLRRLGFALTGAAGTIMLFWLLQPQFVQSIEYANFSNRIQKLLFAAVATLPLNFLIGSTLPLLSAALADQNQEQATNRSFAWVYAAETLGAAIGALFAGFYLIPRIGLSWSLLLAAAATFISALIALSQSLRQQRLGQSILSTRSEFDAEVDSLQFAHWQLLISVAIAGIATMGIEIVWQRFFVLLFGSDTQSFSVVAAVYLAGISLGAYLTRFMAHADDSRKSYATVLVWIAVAITLSTLVMNKVTLDPTSIPWSGDLFRGSPVVYRIVIAASLLIVPTTLIGLALPLAVGCVTNNEVYSAPSVGKIYAATLIGNVLGLLGTGLFISSGNGLRTTAMFLSCCLVLAASIASWSNRPNHSPIWLRNTWTILGVVIWIPTCVVLLGSSHVPLGVDLDSWNLEFYSEGKTNIVAVVSSHSDPGHRQMIIDGVKIGESMGGVNEKQQMLAHLPFLIRNNVDNRTAVTIGLGTGMIASALAENPNVAHVTCVELSADVIRACESFGDLNGDVLRNPKVTIENTDGIRHLQRLESNVDLIVSDAKSRPGHSGNVAFFSRDYYQICASKLEESGIFVQWVSLETAPTAVQTILASFKDSFEFGYIALAPPDSVYLVGSNRPLDRSTRQWDDYLTHCPQLIHCNWRSADDISSLCFRPQIELRNKGQIINRIDQPILEMFALTSAGVSPETKQAG